MRQQLIDSGALSAMDNDALLSRREAWADVRECILLIASVTDTHTVTAGTVRGAYSDRTMQYPNLIGRVWRDLTDSGILTRTGRVAASGNRESGNATRLMPIYKVNIPALHALIEKEKGE